MIAIEVEVGEVDGENTEIQKVLQGHHGSPLSAGIAFTIRPRVAGIKSAWPAKTAFFAE
jgi:hypothetical protein